MKLVLKNFRCYSNRVFEIPDNTMTLINGPSGRGKTTIFLAIQFALYGLSGYKYLISHNSTTCEVVLEFLEFKIKRTKRPNILQVWFNGNLYEGNGAQVILNKYFGVGNNNSFFMDLAHCEKMQFLEKIANLNIDVANLKNSLKNKTLETSKKMAFLDGQISSLSLIRDEFPRPNKVEKPEERSLNINAKEDLRSAAQKLEHLVLLQTKYEKTFNQKLALTNELLSIPDVHPNFCPSQIEHFQSQDELLHKNRELFLLQNNDLLKLQQELMSVSSVDIHELEMLKVQIKKLDEDIELNKQYHKFKQYIDLKALETREWKNEVDKNLAELTLLKDQMAHRLDEQELHSLLASLEEARAFNQTHDLNEITQEIEVLKLSFCVTIQCIYCRNNLTIHADTFTVQPTSREAGLATSSCEIQKPLKKRLKVLESIKDKIVNNNRLLSQNTISEIKKKLVLVSRYKECICEQSRKEVFKPSAVLKRLETKMPSVNVVQPIDSLQASKLSLCISLKEIERTFELQKTLKNKIIKLKAEKVEYDQDYHNKIKEELSKFKDDYYHFKTRLRLLKSIADITEIEFNRDELLDLEKRIDVLKQDEIYLEKYNKYKQYIIHLKRYKKAKDDLTCVLLEKENTTSYYLNLLMFKQKVVDSEHESLQGVINTINAHLQLFLDEFFQEDPIQIYLELINDKKPQINTITSYKGNSVDYKSLSTGEFARIKLAFDLAFYEILGGSILMLDESTANLDQDLSTKIYQKIQSVFPNKTILVISHQAISTPFNTTVSL